MLLKTINKGQQVAFDWTIQIINGQPQVSYLNVQHLKGFYAHLMTSIEHLMNSNKKNKINLIVKKKKQVLDIRRFLRAQGKKLPLKYSLTPKLSTIYLPRFGSYGIKG